MAKEIEQTEELQRIEDPAEIKRLMEKYPPPKCAACGGITGIFGTPGLMKYIEASKVRITCSPECDDVAYSEFALTKEKD